MYKSVSIFCLLLATGLLLSSCKKKMEVFEVADKDITVKAQKIKNHDQEANAINYAVRLTPDKHLIDPTDKKTTTEFWYQMDSSFYIIQGMKKIYPDLIQPIANGVSGTFEYYVAFDPAQIGDGSMKLVYQDKYLNKRKYELSIPN